jgi:hypothetical protein
LELSVLMLLEEGRLGSLCLWYQGRPTKNQNQQYAHVMLNGPICFLGWGTHQH